MTGISDRRVVRPEQFREPSVARGMSDSDVRELLRSIAKNKSRIIELAKLDMRQVGNEMQQAIGKLVARELRGQLPPALAQAVATAAVGPEVMHQLTQRLANSYGNQSERQLGQASTPDVARALATSGSVPQQALRWTQFVQRVVQVPAGQLQDRAGTATPKGELAVLAELLGERRESVGAAGLRTPKLVERSLADLSPMQRAALLSGAVGDPLAEKLLRLGIGDPLSFVQAGALPRDRAVLAEALGVDRGKLLALLMRTELLKIGPGKNGEQGVRLDLLSPLYRSGIAMLGTMAALRALSPQQLALVFNGLRTATGGLARAVRNEHAPTKSDLAHWARSAARRPSDILLADVEDSEQPMSRGDAQDLIAAWYLENRFWDALADHQRVADEDAERQRDQRGDDAEERDDKGGSADSDDFSELEYDAERGDKMMCFWVTDFNVVPSRRSNVRRMYVCIDPDTGAIISQRLEAPICAAP